MQKKRQSSLSLTDHVWDFLDDLVENSGMSRNVVIETLVSDYVFSYGGVEKLKQMLEDNRRRIKNIQLGAVKAKKDGTDEFLEYRKLEQQYSAELEQMAREKGEWTMNYIIELGMKAALAEKERGENECGEN